MYRNSPNINPHGIKYMWRLLETTEGEGIYLQGKYGSSHGFEPYKVSFRKSDGCVGKISKYFTDFMIFYQ